MERSSATINDETTELFKEIDRLKSDLRQMRSDLATVGGDALRTARAGMNESLRAAAAQGKAAADGAQKQIASHPFMAVAAAFAIGMLVGYRSNRKA